jgi:glycosyltransferase involved in cell wall biosynthesis
MQPDDQKLAGLKIARVSTVPYFVATQIKQQIEHLAAHGADVVVITSPGPELQRIDWGPRLRHLPLRIPRSFDPVRDPLALFELTGMLRRGRFDIVHSTTPKGGLLAAIAGRLAGIPLRVHTFTGQPWVTLRGPMAQVARLADRAIGALDTHCYADSASQRQFLIASGVARPEKISVIGDGSIAGVDLMRFDPGRFSPAQRAATRMALGISEQSKVVLFVGRVGVDKGVMEMLEAFHAALAAGIDADLVLVGPFDPPAGPENAVSVSPLLRHPRIHHVGYTDTPEDYMAVADLICLPSYREGFGTVVIEAAAMGVPTLGTDIYGLRDAVADGVTGVLVPAKDAQTLTEKLKSLLAAPEELARLGRAARARAQKLFDARVVNDKVVDEYARLMKGKP